MAVCVNIALVQCEVTQIDMSAPLALRSSSAAVHCGQSWFVFTSFNDRLYLVGLAFVVRTLSHV